MYMKTVRTSFGVEYILTKEFEPIKEKFRSFGDRLMICDEEVESHLKERSESLDITIEELIERYLRRELFTDDYYEPPEYTLEELYERSKKYVEMDRKRGIFPVNRNFDVSNDG